MANQEGNYLALNAALKTVLSRFGINDEGPFGFTKDQPFDRLWFPPTPTIVNPVGLGCYRELPRNPSDAVRVQCNQGFTLTLDTEWTTPQAMIGVKFGAAPSSRTDCVVMVPGQTLEVPSGFSEFWAFAADNLDLMHWVPDTNIVGYVSFIVGRSHGAKPNPVKASPLARVLGIAPAITQPQIIFIPNGCFSHLQIRAACCEAAGVPINSRFVVRYRQTGALRLQPINPALIPLFLTETPDSGLYLPGFGLEFLPVEHFAETVLSSYRDPTSFYYAIGTMPVMDSSQANGIYWDNVNCPSNAAATVATIISASEHHIPIQTVPLYEYTTPVNTILDTGSVPTCDFQSLALEVIFSGAHAGIVNMLLHDVDEAGVSRIVQHCQLTGANLQHCVGWGEGCSVPYLANVSCTTPVPTLVRITISAPGAGITTRLRIVGKRMPSR